MKIPELSRLVTTEVRWETIKGRNVGFHTCPICGAEKKTYQGNKFKIHCRVCNLYNLEEVVISGQMDDDGQIQLISEPWERLGFAQFFYRYPYSFTVYELLGAEQDYGYTSNATERAVRISFVQEARTLNLYNSEIMDWCKSLDKNKRSRTHYLALVDRLTEMGCPLNAEVVKQNSIFVSKKGLPATIANMLGKP